MINRFKNYLDKSFKYLPYTKEADELREEILSGLMERAEDLRAEGKTEEEIYTICIESLGDYTESIKALKRHPFAVFKDAKFHRGLLGVICFILSAVVTYLVLGVTLNLWGVGALIIFPTMAVIIYFFIAGSLLIRNVKFGRHLTSGALISSVLIIFDVSLFFILWECGISPKFGWVVFTYIPFLIVVSHLITRGHLRKKKILYPSYVLLIFSIATALYLNLSMLLGLWHPLWIIFVVAVLISLIWGVALLSRKLKIKSEWK